MSLFYLHHVLNMNPRYTVRLGSFHTLVSSMLMSTMYVIIVRQEKKLILNVS